MEFGVLLLLIPLLPPCPPLPHTPLVSLGSVLPMASPPPPPLSLSPPSHLKLKGSSLSVSVLSEVSSVPSRTQVATCYDCQYCFTT